MLIFTLVALLMCMFSNATYASTAENQSVEVLGVERMPVTVEHYEEFASYPPQYINRDYYFNGELYPNLFFALYSVGEIRDYEGGPIVGYFGTYRGVINI